MMDLLGAGNPYMVRRFAEGGEAVPALTNQQKRANLASFQSLENHLRGIAQDQYNKQMGYAQAMRDEAERAPLSTGLGNPRKAKTAAMKAHMSAARSAGEELKENLDYIRSVRMDLLEGRRTDLSNVALPHLYSFENIVPQRVGATPAPAPSPLVPSQPQPQPQASVQEQAVQPPVPRVPLPTEVPAPSIPGVQAPVSAPSVPVSNLTPQPMPIGGIPQPGMRTLPAYQTPAPVFTTQGQQQPQQPQQSQQIQYGPIGQASTSSSDLLKNLLAATQQSSPYDFTKNNPYLMQNQPVQFFAEGGEAQPAAPSRPQTYQQFIEQAVMRNPEYANIVEDYRLLTSDAVRQYRDQAYGEAFQKMQAELPVLIEQRKQQELQRLTDEMFAKRAADQLQAQQSILSATKPGDRFEYGPTKRIKMGYTVLPDGRLMGDNQTIYTAEDRQRMLDDIDQQLAAQRRTVEMLAPRELKNISSDISNQVAEAYQRDVYEPFAQQRYQELLPRKTNLPFNQMNARTAEIAGQYYGGLPESYYDQLRREPEEMEQAYLKQMEGLPPGETEESYARRMYAIQNMQNEQAAKKQAYEAKLNYLYSPQFDFAKGPGQLDAVYEEAFRQAMSQYPSLTPPSLVTTGSPTGQAAPTPAPTPTTPSAPVVPQPVLPGYATPQSDLSPLPMPGIGVGSVSRVPQPGIGSLPAYQTPMAQAQRPTEQQPQMQIQYGPIGQAATSSSDLLKNLLAATQQSSPYDFTKNNPYLMENQPVQFFAEGGEAQPVERLRGPEQVAENIFKRTYEPQEQDIRQRYAQLQGSIDEKWQKEFLPWFNTVYKPREIEARMQPVYARIADLRSQAEQVAQAKPGDRIPGFMGSTTIINRDTSPEELKQITSSAAQNLLDRADMLLRANRLEIEGEIERDSSAFQDRAVDAFNAEYIVPIQKQMQDLTTEGDKLFNQRLAAEQDLYKRMGEFYNEISTSDMTRIPELKLYQDRLDALRENFNEQMKRDPEGYPRYAQEYNRLSEPLILESQLAARAMQEREDAFLDPSFTGTPEDVDRVRRIYAENFQKYMNDPANRLVQQSTLVPTSPVAPSTPSPTQTAAPTLPLYTTPQPQIPFTPSTPTSPSTPNLTPQPMPGITAPAPIGGIPQPSLGIFGSQSALPTYQTPQTQAPSPTAQAQPQQQIQYGPIGQGAVGQANLLNTLLANQQDPTKVSLLGFDNPYLMKPFG